jgi:transketolase
MRKPLCDALVERAANPNMVFLTGDLGFMALEPLQSAMGPRFVNAGVAEQNMVTVAAAMCAQGLEVWAYSIAPFLYARPFEQIRNDVCFHHLPVKLVGNGGGYGYGVMGPTHHAIDDYGALLTLPGLTVLIPAFEEDVAGVVDEAARSDAPCYLRMGRGEPPPGWVPPPFAAWRQLTEGGGPVVIGVGPVTGTYLSAFEAMSTETRPKLWVVGALPIDRHPLPATLMAQLRSSRRLCVAEEHVAHGSVASLLLLHLAKMGAAPEQFMHLHALAHQYGTYGSQGFMRERSGLDPDAMLRALTAL